MTQAPLTSSFQSTMEQELYETRLNKRDQLEKEGFELYPSAFERSTTSAEVSDKYKELAPGAETNDSVRVAGRLRAIRNSGLFLDLDDGYGRIQLFCHKDKLDTKSQDLLKLLDIGDIIGCSGTVRRTPRGELSISGDELTLLSKTLRALPEKYHGLQDIETRSRQRYLDLIMNPESRALLRQRAEIIHSIRLFLQEKGYLEVETPMLHPIAGGATARPFMTHHNTLDMTLFLRIAPELYLKKLIVGGLSDKIFEINRNFRNEGISPRHNPEFTMLELYAAYEDYHYIKDLLEDLMVHVVTTVHGSPSLTYGEHTLNFQKPWTSKTMVELVEEATKCNFHQIETDEEARAIVKGMGIKVLPTDGWGKCLAALFEEKVEPTLIQPTHVLDFPLEISPLAKVHPDNPRLTERFETYINGWEIANAFSELNDPIEQCKRFAAQMKAKESGDEEAQSMDEDFITALEYGLPPTGGLGIGIDRFTMLLTNAHNIREVIAFPTHRHKPKV